MSVILVITDCDWSILAFAEKSNTYHVTLPSIHYQAFTIK